jgi:uncharacterized membrane protein YkvA (DUF1232 family)
VSQTEAKGSPSGNPDEGANGSLTDIQAVIESAKARGGMDALERFIRRRLSEAEEAEVREAAEVALEIMESIPVFLARARQEADERAMRSVVGPLLDHAERYFLQPVDLLPEMTLGLAGLLDDCYLFFRIIQHLEAGPEPFLDWDLEHPQQFLRSLMGEEITKQLDDIAMDAMRQVSSHLAELWTRMSHPA